MKSSAQALKWAKHFGGSNDERDDHIAIDNKNNIFTVGLFTGLVDFNPGPGVSTLTSTHPNDFFLSKFDSSGNFIWVKTFGGTIQCTAITSDTASNIYLTGWFTGLVDFDFDTSTTYNLTAQQYTPFILKIDNNGSFIFAKIFETPNSGFSYSLDVNDAEQIAIAGSFSGSIDCDPGAGSYMFTSAGLSDAFSILLDSDGTLIWGVRMGGAFNDQANSICFDPSGNTYCTGYFQSTANLFPDTSLTSLTSNGTDDIFIFKVNSIGTVEWIDQFGGNNSDFGNEIKSDSQGNIYVAGNFQSTIDFDNGPGITMLSPTQSSDIYLVKIDSLGNSIWAEQLSGSSLFGGLAMKISKNNKIYIAGVFVAPADFDPGPSVFNLSPVGGTDGFLIELSTNGSMSWVKAFGGVGYDYCASVCTDNSDQAFVSGTFSYTVDFDPNGAVYNLTSNGALDVFLIKLGPCTPTIFSPSALACHTFTLNGISYDSTGIYIQNLNNLAGCDSTIILHLTIYSTNANVSVNGGTITANMNLATYQWLDCNNNYAAISGETNQSFSPTTNGNFAVSVTSSNCTDTSVCVQVNSAKVNNISNKSIQLYPNPASRYIMIKSIDEIETIKIFNLTNYCLLTSYSISEPLDISQLSPGVYVVEAKTKNQYISKQLLIKN